MTAFLGVDLGSTCVKAVLVDASGAVLAHALRRTGLDFAGAATAVRAEMLDAAARLGVDVGGCVATGYGRHDAAFADRAVTEVTCQTEACRRLFGGPLTIVDVGGQDTKVIRLDDLGNRLSFLMNRKCADGTGSFLEEMAARMDVPASGLESLAAAATDAVPLSSYCTVFAKSELVALARAGNRPEAIALGVLDAVVRRVQEMDPLEGPVALTGGVAAHFPTLVRRLEVALGRPVLVPSLPQHTGALGAALLAMDCCRAGASAPASASPDPTPDEAEP